MNKTHIDRLADSPRSPASCNSIRILLVILTFILIARSVALADDNYDFRKTRWGMSQEEVKNSEENIPILDEGNLLIYQGNLSNFDVAITYEFLSDNLVIAGYMIQVTHTEKTRYIDDYLTIKKLLIKKYGPPLSDNIQWKNDLYQDQLQSWGLAVSLGHLAYSAIWRNKRSTILIILSGENYKINLSLVYTSEEHDELVRENKQQKTLDDL